MDTGSCFLAMSSDSLDEIVKPEMRQEYKADKKNWLATEKFSERTPGLFKPEFVGTRGMWLTSKSYLVQNQKIGKNKISCKGILKKHNGLYYGCYKEDVLDVFQKARIDCELEGEDIDKLKNVGFRVYDQGIVT